MNIHRDVSEIINSVVLRDVIQIHGMEIPYPAELWVNGNRHYEDGTAMFGIGDGGYLTAEYFGYDGVNPLEWLGMGFKRLDAKLVMKDTRVEIPIWWISSNPKARTRHSVQMPQVTAYKCEIQGLLGESGSEMNSVSITVAGLSNIHLGQVTSPLPEQGTAVENLTLHGFKKQIGQLNIEAGEWQIRLTASYADYNPDYQPLHHIQLSRKDGSPFVLGDDIDSGIINALKQFLSFQCGRWVDMPTVVCNPVYSTIEKRLTLREGETSEAVLSAVRKYRASERSRWEAALDELGHSLVSARGFEDVSDTYISGGAICEDKVTIHFNKGEPTKRQAWVSNLSSPDIPAGNTWTATDIRLWPKLFSEFWRQYSNEDSQKHLTNAVHHYIEAQRVFDDGTIGQALVAGQSTLQALTRWWNGLCMNFRFGRVPKNRFDDLAVKAVREARLGCDDGVVIDEQALRDVIKTAGAYRNDIDHGRGGNMTGQGQSVVDCHMHHHNLARLLILAKLGNHNRDARGCLAGPVFTEVTN